MQAAAPASTGLICNVSKAKVLLNDKLPIWTNQHKHVVVADDLSDSSETGWEWLSALSQKANKPLPPIRSISGINPLFQGDIARATSPTNQPFLRSQSFNPLFKAQHAQHEQLEVDPNSWQLHGLVANPRTTPQERGSLAWNQGSTSSSSIVALPAPTVEAEPRLTDASEAGGGGDIAVCMARLLAQDRQDSADWVSSSSSSEDAPPPLRSLSVPAALLEATIRREEVALGKPLGRDTSLPVSFQAGFDTSLWSTDQAPAAVPRLRQQFPHQQQQPQPKQADAPTDQADAEQPDIWAALERQPSPVITLRQRYTQAQQQLQQQLAGQGSAMQPGQSLLELTPEDIVLQEPGSASDDMVAIDLQPGVYGHQQQAPPPDQGLGGGEQSQQASAGEHQQSGLPLSLALSRYDGVSARSVSRQLKKLPTAMFSEPQHTRELKKLPTALFSEPQQTRQLKKLSTALFSEPQPNREEGLDRGVRFGSGTVAVDADWPQAPRTLPRARSSLKQQRSPRGSLRKRSFRKQASSVSFAAVSTASDDSSSDSGGSVSGKTKPRPGLAGAASLAAPLVKTASSVWALISSGAMPDASAQTAVYQAASSHEDEADLPHVASARPPLPAPRSGSSLWQIASKKAAAGQMTPQASIKPGGSTAQRPRFASFWDAVAQASTNKPSLGSTLGPEHLEQGVKVLLEARQKARTLDRLKSSRSERGGKMDRQQSLAKVMQVLQAKQMGKSVSMASTLQVATLSCTQHLSALPLAHDEHSSTAQEAPLLADSIFQLCTLHVVNSAGGTLPCTQHLSALHLACDAQQLFCAGTSTALGHVMLTTHDQHVSPVPCWEASPAK